LLAALASWLDARAHEGRWLVRIEDVDTPRCVPQGGEFILHQLAQVGLVPDEPPVWQSQRSTLYQHALDTLAARGHAYLCACSRKDIALAIASAGGHKARHSELIYPGTCRTGLQGRAGRAWRFRTDLAPCNRALAWHDRRLGAQVQDVAQEVGDFVLFRADGLWAYQLAVVVDDAKQGITHVVRGEDLADNTARQIALQHALGLQAVSYLHTPLVLGPNGEKLSKQNGAAPLDLQSPTAALCSAAAALGLRPAHGTMGELLALWTAEWRERFS
jgi:glutamyl-Q tRNA(Asp) synthetase